MTDQPTNRHQPGKPRIDLSRDYERRNWAESFGVTEDELKHAVHAAGDAADKVRDYLQMRYFIKRLEDYVKHRKPPSPAR